MPEKIIRTFRSATRVSGIGAAILYGLAACCLCIACVYLFSFVNMGTDYHAVGWWLTALASTLSITLATALLARFLQLFCRSRSPFCARQSHRLLMAAGLFCLHSFLNSIVPPFDSMPVAFAGITLVPQSGLDLKVVVMVVFLVCLAMVVRYGDALKEDSDAFV